MGTSAKRVLLFVALLIPGHPCFATSYGFFETLGGSADCRAISGNGRLTVGVDASGRIVACRWPGPGHANHVTGRGLEWGIRAGDRVDWLDDTRQAVNAQTVPADGPFIRTETSVAAIPGSVVQEAFVHADHDIIASRIATSPEVDGDILFYADLSPCTAVIPEVPFLDFLSTGARDFAAFVDGSIVYHFRPLVSTSQDWHETRRWAHDPEHPEPEAFERDGVWIAYTFADGVHAASCGPATGEHSILNAVTSGRVAGAVATTGDCASTAYPVTASHERERTATVFIAFGASREEVDQSLAFALEQGYEGLRQGTQDAWTPVLAGATSRVSRDFPEFEEPLASALMSISMATSQESGAIVRAPGPHPQLSVDYPRHSAWAGLALDYLGLTETSQRHLLFLLANVRTIDSPGMPAGSTPAALHGDGKEGLPRVVLDSEAVGWLLWVLHQHYEILDPDRHEAFAETAWPHVVNMSAFLMSRSSPAPGVPIYAFDPRRLKEASTDEFLISACIGLRSAAAMAHAAGEERLEWQDRVKQLEDLLRARALSADGNWVAQRPLSYWAAGIMDSSDPRWEPATDRALATVEQQPPDQALRDLCDLAFLWRDQPDRLDQLRSVLHKVILQPRERPTDTLDAARIILAIILVCGA